MNDAYFGNKTISINQRRYLGSKTKLLNFIDDIIKNENIKFESFADIFAGTGTVANHFYDRSKIIVNDILDSNNYIYHAFLGEDRIREEKLKERLNFYNGLNVKDYKDNYFSNNFSNNITPNCLGEFMLNSSPANPYISLSSFSIDILNSSPSSINLSLSTFTPSYSIYPNTSTSGISTW